MRVPDGSVYRCQVRGYAVLISNAKLGPKIIAVFRMLDDIVVFLALLFFVTIGELAEPLGRIPSKLC